MARSSLARSCANFGWKRLYPFDSAFYFISSAGTTAFAQSWGIDLIRGKATACRWHVLGDSVDFAGALEMGLEIGPRDPSLLDRYRTVAFLYRQRTICDCDREGDYDCDRGA